MRHQIKGHDQTKTESCSSTTMSLAMCFGSLPLNSLLVCSSISPKTILFIFCCLYKDPVIHEKNLYSHDENADCKRQTSTGTFPLVYQIVSLKHRYPISPEFICNVFYIYYTQTFLFLTANFAHILLICPDSIIFFKLN